MCVNLISEITVRAVLHSLMITCSGSTSEWVVVIFQSFLFLVMVNAKIKGKVLKLMLSLSAMKACLGVDV